MSDAERDRALRPARRPVLMRVCRVGQGLLVLLCLAWAVFERPAPVVTVAWKDGVSAEARGYVERQLQLANPQASDDVWQYELTSPRAADIKALVTHPSVKDTSHIDRDQLAVKEPGVGTLRVWWRGPFRGVRGRVWFRGLVAGIAFLTVGCAVLAAPTRTPAVRL